MRRVTRGTPVGTVVEFVNKTPSARRCRLGHDFGVLVRVEAKASHRIPFKVWHGPEPDDWVRVSTEEIFVPEPRYPRREEREVVWVRGRKAPVIKFEHLDFDVLEVRVAGSEESTFTFPIWQLRRFVEEHQGPHHYTFKMDPNLLRVFQKSRS